LNSKINLDFLPAEKISKYEIADYFKSELKK
jgi:hypothetical protein